MTSGKRLKEIRLKLGLSQEQLGEKIGLSTQGISNVENDKSFFHIDKLEKLVELGVNLNYLVNGVGRPFLQFDEADTDFIQKVEKILKDKGII